MSPASVMLKKLRLQRHLTQSDVGVFLGCEQSYVSALELGLRNLNINEVNKIVVEFTLTDSEEDDFRKAFRLSNRSFKLPRTCSELHYEIVNNLFSKIEQLNIKQLELITFALELE